VAGYDAKTGFDVAPDVALLRRLGVNSASTVVDLGAGTGLLAAALAPHVKRVVAVDPSPTMLAAAEGRKVGIECVRAGFLSYEHVGKAADAVYSRNALHHLPDIWKAVALRRVADLLRLGGVFVLRDITYACDPAELDAVLESWFEAAPSDPSHGWTRTELEAHVRNEHSTFTWLLKPMLERAGFRIHEVWHSDSRTYAQYVCIRAGHVPE
jgi:SAM-dependent methyltransferase